MQNLYTDLLAQAATGSLDAVLKIEQKRREAVKAEQARTIAADVQRRYDYASQILELIPACTTRILLTTLYSKNAKLIDRSELLKTAYNSRMAAILKNQPIQ